MVDGTSDDIVVAARASLPVVTDLEAFLSIPLHQALFIFTRTRFQELQNVEDELWRNSVVVWKFRCFPQFCFHFILFFVLDERIQRKDEKQKHKRSKQSRAERSRASAAATVMTNRLGVCCRIEGHVFNSARGSRTTCGRSLSTQTEPQSESSDSNTAMNLTVEEYQQSMERSRREKASVRLKKDQSYQTSVGILLCRSPIITRELSDFEQAFYAYQRHLKSRLASPFPIDFYFTKGSLAAKRWQAGEDARRRADELVSPRASNSQENDVTTGAERELQDEEDIAAQVAMSRITEADKSNDTHSLDRKLDRTLYLLLKKPRERHTWQLPQGVLGAGEVLHESSSRVLKALAGADMKTWQVGKVPVGHLSYSYPDPRQGHNGNKVYYLKSRIFAGQCRPAQGSGISDFGWFTSEEVGEKVGEKYWKQIRYMLSAQ